jgi:hypothetical protein
MNYNIIIGLILILVIVLKLNNKINLNWNVLLLSVAIILLLLKYNNVEHMTDTEVLSNIGTVFDTNKMKVTNK